MAVVRNHGDNLSPVSFLQLSAQNAFCFLNLIVFELELKQGVHTSSWIDGCLFIGRQHVQHIQQTGEAILATFWSDRLL